MAMVRLREGIVDASEIQDFQTGEVGQFIPIVLEDFFYTCGCFQK